jgi:hypothetical protein
MLLLDIDSGAFMKKRKQIINQLWDQLKKSIGGRS